jgi:nitroreductase
MTTHSKEVSARQGRADRDEKRAPTSVPIEDDIRSRWSPRAFSERVVKDEDLRVLLEAARWAPSSYNEQPWRFIVAKREDEEQFAKMLACLDDGNQRWAGNASVLMLTVASMRFDQDGGPNRHAFHDVGLAMGNLTQQAMSKDLYVHQMAGIHTAKAHEVYGVPPEFEVVAGVAVGYLGDPETIEDSGRRRSETTARQRKALDEIVFECSWGRAAGFLAEPGAVSHRSG